MDRRDFLKLVGVTAATAASSPAWATHTESSSTEFVGVLTDTTLCIGCRRCEEACAREHGLPVPENLDDPSVFKDKRSTDETRRTVVNRFHTSKGDVYVKRQCMHCWQPACTAACLTEAMYKTKDGPIIWRSGKCMGCRYCMVSCPFVVPKFEYDSWNPNIVKCDMCYDRLQQGKVPACVEACPMEALTFAKKRKLIEIASTRMQRWPEKYHPHIYGQYEVGGTSWLYLSPAPFDQIGFKTDLGTSPLPEYTREFLYAVPGVFLLVPSFLFGMHLLSSRKETVGQDEEK